MQLLVVNQFADRYKKALEPKFPELKIHAVAREEEIGDLIEDIDILLVFAISDAVIKRAKKLKWLQALITGVDRFVNLPSLKKDVLITSTRGIHGPQMSEITFLLLLAVTRNYPQMVRNQDAELWERWPQKLLYRKKVGILGVGVIGREIARKCKAFDMTVYGITRTKREIDFVDHAFGPEGLLEVMAEVDYFINVVPSTPETHKMIGAEAFSRMKPTAFFINVGRGDTVDEEAMIQALKTGQIAGAALDVVYTTPLPKGHPLWKMKNVVITPMVGGMSDIYAEQALPIVEENLRRFLKGERRELINYIAR